MSWFFWRLNWLFLDRWRSILFRLLFRLACSSPSSSLALNLFYVIDGNTDEEYEN